MEKKKPSAAGTVGTAVTLVIYMLVGVFSSRLLVTDPVLPEDTPGSFAMQLLLLLVFFYLGFAVQIAIHEGGHLVCGLWTGYRFCSYRFFSLMWIRQEGKLRFRRLSLAGTGGQCLLAPPDRREDCPYVLYNLGGVLANLVSALIFWALALVSPPLLRLLLKLTAIAGLASALLNGLPLRIGPVDNDGRNILSIHRSAAARRAFWTQMKIGQLQAEGRRLRDMPEDWFTNEEEGGANNSILAAVPVFRAQRLMDAHRFDEAAALQDRLLADSSLMGLYRGMLNCDRIFCRLLGGGEPTGTDALPDKAQQSFMKSMKNYPSVLRTRFALALLHDHDPAAAEKIRAAFERMAHSYPYPVELESERELMALAEKKASE